MFTTTYKGIVLERAEGSEGGDGVLGLKYGVAEVKNCGVCRVVGLEDARPCQNYIISMMAGELPALFGSSTISSPYLTYKT